jgi:uncharacterized protein YqeY
MSNVIAFPEERCQQARRAEAADKFQRAMEVLAKYQPLHQVRDDIQFFIDDMLDDLNHRLTSLEQADQ